MIPQDTGQKKTILSLQVIRAFSCIIIYLSHATRITDPSHWAVSVFFVLSGFVMTYSYWERAPVADAVNAAKFSVKKIKPLFLLHIIMLLLGLIREVIMNPVLWRRDLTYLMIAVPLLQSWFPTAYQALNSVDWYLSVTLFLYFVFPFILSFLKKQQYSCNHSVFPVVGVIFLQFLIGAAVGSIFPRFIKWITYCFPIYRLGDFFIGSILGYLFKNRRESEESCGRATFVEVSIALASVVSWYLARTVLKEYKWVTYTCLYVPSSACLIYVFAKEEGILSRIITNKITLSFASLSAYFFLIHRQVLFWIDDAAGFLFNKSMNGWVLAIIAFPFAYYCMKLYLYIERRWISQKEYCRPKKDDCSF